MVRLEVLPLKDSCLTSLAQGAFDEIVVDPITGGRHGWCKKKRSVGDPNRQHSEVVESTAPLGFLDARGRCGVRRRIGECIPNVLRFHVFEETVCREDETVAGLRLPAMEIHGDQDVSTDRLGQQMSMRVPIGPLAIHKTEAPHLLHDRMIPRQLSENPTAQEKSLRISNVPEPETPLTDC